MIPVTDDHGESAGFVKHFGVGAGKVGKLPQWRILFENDLAIVVGVDLQGVPLADAHGAADLFGDDDPAEVVDSSYDSGCFHLSISP